MTFGAPHWLSLLLLALPIVALYTRRPERRVVRVPALWLWTAVAGQAPAPGRRLLGRLDERLLALLLFLVALLGTVLGLARPGDERREARAVAVVVDVGAATGVRDGAPARRRIERAREALVRLDATLGPDDRRWVVVAGATPHVLVGPGEPLPPDAPAWEGGRADLAGGLALARAVLEGAGPSAGQVEVWALTADLRPLESPPDGPPVRVVDLRASPGPAVDLALDGTLERLDAAHVRLRTVVENRGRASAAALVEVRLDGVPLVRETPQPVAPGDRLAFAPRDLPCAAGGVVEVRLASASDDPGLTWVVPPPRRLRVGLDDPRGDRFLAAALAADPAVEVVAPSARPIDALVTTVGGPTPADVGAVLRVGPAALDGAVGLVLAAPGHDARRPDAGREAPPVAASVGPSSPRLSPSEGGDEDGDLDLGGLDLEDRLIAGAPRVEAGPGWRTLVRAGEGPDAPPLLLVRDDAAGREVVLAFEPAATDLVLGRAFPLLVARALRWATRHDDPAPRWTRAGEVVTVGVPVDAAREAPAARAPDGTSLPLAVLPDGRAALRLERGPGTYDVVGASVAARAALPPRDARPTSPSSGELEGVPRPAPPVEWAGACVLLALLALLAEAVVFHRRGLP